MRLRHQRLDGGSAQAVLEHHEQNAQREHGYEAKEHVSRSHP